MSKAPFLLVGGFLLAFSSCKHSGAPGPAPAGVNSTALAVGNTTDFAVSSSLIALRVNESQQNGSNLNGSVAGGTHNDADASDKVVFLFGTNSQIATNVKLAGSDPGNFVFAGNVLAFTVNESSEGNVPLDNDGAVSDEDILFLFSLSTGSKINTAQAVTKATIWGDENILAFRLPSGNLGWLRIATPSTIFDSGVALIASPVPRQDILVEDGYITFLDSNSIPRAIDTVSASSPVTLGGGLAAFRGSLFLTDQRLVFLQAEGASAKNGDADTSDYFPTLVDLSAAIQGSSSTTSLNIEAETGTFQLSGERVAFLRDEAQSGGAGNDWNDDGDATDSVLFWIDLGDFSNPNNTQLAARELALHGENLAVSVPENEQSGSSSGFTGDLNSDGDTGLDRVVFLLDLSTSPASITGLNLDGESLTIGENVLVFGCNESLQGEDLNDDGVISSGSVVSQGVDLRFRTVRNLQWQADEMAAVGNRAFFRVPEGQPGFGDLNRDGDQGDSVLAFYDIDDSEGQVTSATILKAGFFGVYSSHSLFVFLTDEADLGRDINGDNDESDRVLRYLKFLD